MSESAEETYKRKKDVILKIGKNYYGNDKKRLRDQPRDKYRNLSEEEKNKNREYGRERYRNMFKEKKQELKNIKKITVRLKSLNLIINKIVFNYNFIVYAMV